MGYTGLKPLIKMLFELRCSIYDDMIILLYRTEYPSTMTGPQPIFHLGKMWQLKLNINKCLITRSPLTFNYQLINNLKHKFSFCSPDVKAAAYISQ